MNVSTQLQIPNFWAMQAAVPFCLPPHHSMCSCWQVLWAAAGSIPFLSLLCWATHWTAECATALLCCLLPQSGQSSRSHQATGHKFRELDLGGKSWGLTQSHQIRTESSLTLAPLICSTHLKISFMKIVNADLLEIPLSTKRTSTVIDNGTE